MKHAKIIISETYGQILVKIDEYEGQKCNSATVLINGNTLAKAYIKDRRDVESIDNNEIFEVIDSIVEQWRESNKGKNCDFTKDVFAKVEKYDEYNDVCVCIKVTEDSQLCLDISHYDYENDCIYGASIDYCCYENAKKTFVKLTPSDVVAILNKSSDELISQRNEENKKFQRITEMISLLEDAYRYVIEICANGSNKYAMVLPIIDKDILICIAEINQDDSELENAMGMRLEAMRKSLNIYSQKASPSKHDLICLLRDASKIFEKIDMLRDKSQHKLYEKISKELRIHSELVIENLCKELEKQKTEQ